MDSVDLVLDLTSVAVELRVSVALLRRVAGAAEVIPERAREVAGDTRLWLVRTLLTFVRVLLTSSALRFFEDDTM